MDWWLFFAVASAAIVILALSIALGGAAASGGERSRPSETDCADCEGGWLKEYRAGGAYSYRQCPEKDGCARSS